MQFPEIEKLFKLNPFEALLPNTAGQPFKKALKGHTIRSGKDLKAAVVQWFR